MVTLGCSKKRKQTKKLNINGVKLIESNLGFTDLKIFKKKHCNLSKILSVCSYYWFSFRHKI